MTRSSSVTAGKTLARGDRLTADWLGPYKIKEITPKGVCVLSNKDGIALKTKTNSCHLKPYVQRVVNPPCTDVSDTSHTDHTYAISNNKRPFDSFEESSSGLTPERNSRCRLEQPSQTSMDDDDNDNDEPIVGVVAFAKSCSIENIEAVLDIADTCTRPWAKDPKKLPSLVNINPVVSLLEQDTECNSVTAVAKVLADVRPSCMSEDLYSYFSGHLSYV